MGHDHSIKLPSNKRPWAVFNVGDHSFASVGGYCYGINSCLRSVYKRKRVISLIKPARMAALARLSHAQASAGGQGFGRRMRALIMRLPLSR